MHSRNTICAHSVRRRWFRDHHRESGRRGYAPYLASDRRLPGQRYVHDQCRKWLLHDRWAHQWHFLHVHRNGHEYRGNIDRECPIGSGHSPSIRCWIHAHANA